MKPFIIVIISTFLGLYAICAFVSWDIAVMAHATENGRVAYIIGGFFISGIISCMVAHIQSEE